MNLKTYIDLEIPLNDRIYIFSMPWGAPFADCHLAAQHAVEAIKQMAQEALDKQKQMEEEAKQKSESLDEGFKNGD